MLKSNQFHMQFCFGVVRVGSQSSITKEKCGDMSDSYTEKRVCRCTIAPAVCGGAGSRSTQSSNCCEFILSTKNEYSSNRLSHGGMQSNGGSRGFACFDCVLGADWPG